MSPSGCDHVAASAEQASVAGALRLLTSEARRVVDSATPHGVAISAGAQQRQLATLAAELESVHREKDLLWRWAEGEIQQLRDDCERLRAEKLELWAWAQDEIAKLSAPKETWRFFSMNRASAAEVVIDETQP